jgi:hypothetical protein
MIKAIRRTPSCVDIAQGWQRRQAQSEKSNKEKLDPSFDNIQNTNG